MYLFLYQFIYFHGKGATSWASYKRQVIPSCINSVTVGYNKIDKIIWTIVTSFFFLEHWQSLPLTNTKIWCKKNKEVKLYSGRKLGVSLLGFLLFNKSREDSFTTPSSVVSLCFLTCMNFSFGKDWRAWILKGNITKQINTKKHSSKTVDNRDKGEFLPNFISNTVNNRDKGESLPNFISNPFSHYRHMYAGVIMILWSICKQTSIILHRYLHLSYIQIP